MATLTETQIKALPAYSWQQAKAAYERGERTFICSPRYSVRPKISLKPCGDFCGLSVIVEHRDSGYLMIRCERCRAEMTGGKYELGLSESAPKQKRLFGDLQRAHIFRRDLNRCFKCGAGPEDDTLEVDHVVPHAAGGPTNELNGITLCRSCNQAKSDEIDIDFINRALMWTHKRDGQKLYQLWKEVAQSWIAWGCKDLV